MVDFILFMVFSIMETSMMYYLMFRLFKFDMYPVSIVFASAVASFFSYTIRNVYEIQSVDIPVQIFLMFMFVWLLFRTHFFYAAIMTCTVYVGYFILQIAYYFLLNGIGLFDSRLPIPSAIGTYLLQIATASTALLLGLWIKRNRKGFDFVPHSQYEVVKMNKINIAFLGLSLLSVSLMSLLYLTNQIIQLFYLPLALVLIMYFILYFAYKKDRSDD
ncbi:hypothetical protein NLX71_15760 [Paenibacillus sp. MZ04-78.2]|uniref:hypothetical protein n=1 Tax=Paenibacillus sp. MZ04-78.2 TaxID=2962034 RepID=UPI0020B74463|nr:hypothetical protein [Paenibacillus sp. MZ04-78.2]MCP3774748.1 hypothetical protein [Paenibacillus sp. MZ04-78.2]